jgi:uncharacterized protein (DUF2236 family)
MFPAGEEVPDPVIRPDSIAWRRGGDPRMFPAVGYALLLQVAHPTVASGVRDHSEFEQAPWTRLLRTLDWITLTLYGGQDAVGAGKQLRAYHRLIYGTNPDGSTYHALERGAYAWVHATLVDAMVVAHARFGRPLRPDQIERFYREWLSVGRMIGVRPGDLPADWDSFRGYFDEMVETRLRHTETVDRVLRALRHPRSPVAVLPSQAWAVASYPLTHLMLLATVGLLPPVLRSRFGLTWSLVQECQLAAWGAASRSITPLMPGRLRVMGPAYLQMRRRRMIRGPLNPAATRGPDVETAR